MAWEEESLVRCTLTHIASGREALLIADCMQEVVVNTSRTTEDYWPLPEEVPTRAIYSLEQQAVRKPATQ